jgi:two-component system, OmpR family, manganese sensing response regulator
MNILLVDDEVELTAPLSRLLRQEGYEVDVAADGLTGQQLSLDRPYDLYILDWVLPLKNGIEICRSLRSTGNSKPVLFLTAQDTLDDRVLGLDAGADDYLIKPFELRELLARIRALLRRTPGNAAPEAVPQLQVGNLTLDVENQTAYLAGKTIELSEKEAALLTYLMQHAGQVVSHQQIYEQLWGIGAELPNSNVLAALMRLLRRKLAIKGQPETIHTVYGKGYRLSRPDP